MSTCSTLSQGQVSRRDTDRRNLSDRTTIRWKRTSSSQLHWEIHHGLSLHLPEKQKSLDGWQSTDSVVAQSWQTDPSWAYRVRPVYAETTPTSPVRTNIPCSSTNSRIRESPDPVRSSGRMPHQFSILAENTSSTRWALCQSGDRVSKQ